MEIREAYEVLGLEIDALEEDITEAYKKLIKIHHPDKNSESELSYKLNEARELLLAYSQNEANKEVALYVSHALMNIRETDKKEREIRNEIDLLISSGVSSKRNRIEKYRNYSIVGTFLLAVLTFISSSSNGIFDSYFNKQNTYEIMNEIALEMYPKTDSMGLNNDLYTHPLDSLYLYDEKFRNTVKTREEIYKSRDTKSVMIKTMFGLYAAILVFAVAFFQMRIKQYDSDLEQFKKIIDIKSKLKRLILKITEEYRLEMNCIEESTLLDCIELIFNNSKFDLKDEQLNQCLKLGQKLAITDLGRIVLLKFVEKDIIIEIDSPESNTQGVWYKVKA